VSDNIQKGILKKLLLNTGHSSRLWAAMSALCIGATLLLLAVMIWWNFRELLYGKNQQDTLGSTFMIIGKRVTEQNMGIKNATIFNTQEIDSLKTAPEVEDIGEISTNHFPVYAMMGGRLAFATDLPLECVPDKFIDKIPEGWQWEAGNRDLPIIISSQFLDIYNYVFAPSQNLPKLSETSVKSIALNLKVGSGDNVETYKAHVVGFSDRIGSVLAPKSFIDYGNAKFGKAGASFGVSQLILKTKDPSNTKFAEYLKNHDYNTNAQNLRFSKIRGIVEVVASATGVLAILLMGIGSLVFILFIELTIAKSRESLNLLLQIGYSPRYVAKYMISKFLPLVAATLATSMIITVTGQAIVSKAAVAQGLIIDSLPGWPVWIAWIVSILLLTMLVVNSISNAIKK
jgi:hypothetical protein